MMLYKSESLCKFHKEHRNQCESQANKIELSGKNYEGERYSQGAEHNHRHKDDRGQCCKIQLLIA